MKKFSKLILFTSFSVLAVLATGSNAASPANTDKSENFTQLVEVINKVMFEHHYNIRELQEDDYQSVLNSMRALGKKSTSREEFIMGFRDIWKSGPFSHVVLRPNNRTAEQMAMFLDNMDAGESGAQLSFQNEVAVLTVNTMMGQDTIKKIRSFYQTVAESNAKALIIDLRSNEGGAFAIRPLVSHLIDKPLTAGYFLAQKWSSQYTRLPTLQELNKLEPWSGWSVISFWKDVQEQALVKVQFQPADLYINLPVYVLTSSKTASASELATEALQSLGRVTVIGERTAGQMLSQKPYDVSNGLQLYVPIADYYSINTGRLEGNPIEPNIEVNADEAMEMALSLASKFK